MASNYWLKLYHETIYDPKVMMMSPGARLRFFECLCLAGDWDHNGELPPESHMTFVFRISAEQLRNELNELITANIVTLENDVYSIKNWNKRQGALSNAERVANYRQSKRKAEYYDEDEQPNEQDDDPNEEDACNEPVTNRYTTVTNSVTNRYTDKIKIKKREERERDKDRERARARSPNPKNNNDIPLLFVVEQLTGFDQTHEKDLAAIKEMVSMGATDEDIIGAVEWISKQGKVARYARYLLNTVKTEVGKRKQSGVKAERKDHREDYRRYITDPNYKNLIDH